MLSFVAEHESQVVTEWAGVANERLKLREYLLEDPIHGRCARNGPWLAADRERREQLWVCEVKVAGHRAHVSQQRHPDIGGNAVECLASLSDVLRMELNALQVLIKVPGDHGCHFSGKAPYQRFVHGQASDDYMRRLGISEGAALVEVEEEHLLVTLSSNERAARRPKSRSE